MDASFVAAPCMRLSTTTGSASGGKNQRTKSKRVPREVSSLSVGELLIGVVDSVGGAQSAWIDVNVATKRRKPVCARLRLRNDAAPTVGAMLPVVVSRLNIPAARIEVQRSRAAQLGREMRRLEDLRTGDELHGKVVGMVTAGAVIDVGVTRQGRRGKRVVCTALMRRCHFPLTWASTNDLLRRDNTERVLALGDEISVYVRDAQPASAFLYVCVDRIDEAQLQKERAAKVASGRKRGRRRGVDVLKVGEARPGTVRAVAKFGVFVDLGIKKDGLVHYSNMESLKYTWKDELVVGTQVIVRVIAVENERINLELVQLPGVTDVDKNLVEQAFERPQPLQAQREMGEEETVSTEASVKSEIGSKENSLEEDAKEEDENMGDDADTEEEESTYDEVTTTTTTSLDGKFTDEYFEDKYDF